MIGLHIYDGLFKVIPIDQKGTLKEAYNIRYELEYPSERRYRKSMPENPLMASQMHIIYLQCSLQIGRIASD
jgi:hypothetical protein